VSKGKRLKAERAAQRAIKAAAAAFASADFSRKLDRAITHIDALDDSIKGWLDSGAYTIVEEVEPETGYQIVVPKITEEFRDEWPLLIGDAVHNMRSALDHLAYALALKGYDTANPGQPFPEAPKRQIMFPIVAVSRDKRRTVEQVYDDVAKVQLRYVAPDATARIKGLQPYERSPAAPLTDPLSLINELDIIDKHRRLNAMAIAPPLQSLQIGGGDIYIDLLEMLGGPIKHDTPIMRYGIRAAGPTPVHMHRRFGRAVALSDGPAALEGREVVGALRELRGYILHTVLPEFTEFF
jgi:hypothetical protein